MRRPGAVFKPFLFSAILGSGCTWNVKLAPQAHAPSPPARKLQLEVALVRPEHYEDRIVVGYDGFLAVFRGNLHEAFLGALRTDLAGIFQGFEVVEASAAVKADYVATLDPGFPKRVALAFRLPSETAAAASFERPGFAPRRTDIGNSLAQLLLFPLVPFVESVNARAHRKEMETWVSDTVHALTAAIRAGGEALELPIKLAPMLKAGERALAADRRDEALERYLSALKACSPGSEEEARVRRKVVGLVRSMPQPPPVPEEARHRADRAQAFLKRAQDAEGYRLAIGEFESALRLAPWWADIHFNLGLVREKAGDLAGAIRSLQDYLAAAPEAKDSEEVRRKIVDLEVAQELSGKQGGR